MNFRRSRTKVLFDILWIIRQENGRSRPTRILYKANLSHKLLKQYLNFLIAGELIKEVKSGDIVFYELTEKGNNFIAEFRRLEKLAIGFGMPI